MRLEKLTIFVEKQPFDPVKVLFNPGEITITQTGWNSDSKLGLTPADTPATLSVNLFFDTSLPQPSSGGLLETAATALVGRSSLLPSLGKPKDVRRYTQPIYDLTKPRGDLGKPPRPPICQLQWGRQSLKVNEILFQGVLKSVTQTFKRFLEDGTPVRATLNCMFEEWEVPEFRAKLKNPIDDPIRIVKRGETLSSIATEEYGDPALWRVIAIENRLTDPRQLQPGQRLTVPPLRPDRRIQGR